MSLSLLPSLSHGSPKLSLNHFEHFHPGGGDISFENHLITCIDHFSEKRRDHIILIPHCTCYAI